jgi:hypothetical protein
MKRVTALPDHRALPAAGAPASAVARLLGCFALALGCAACKPAGAAGSQLPGVPRGASVALVGAGDIASCESDGYDDDDKDHDKKKKQRKRTRLSNPVTGVSATGRLLDSLVRGGGSVVVFTAGDNAYGEGTPGQFAGCYDQNWGRHRSITRPSPGNHDYKTRGARGYFDYFGDLAGPSGRGYYSYDLADWHMISLNSEIETSAGSAQERWLRDDLKGTTKRCVLAYWHQPRFSSGKHGSLDAMQPLWEALYEHGAELVLNGHDHDYERFAPQTPDGERDEARGIRQFVAGTGGRSLRAFESPVANSEVRYNRTHGLLKMTLGADSYSWEFIPVSGSFRDTGRGRCH